MARNCGKEEGHILIKTVVRSRCREFAEMLEEQGFPSGCTLNAKELRYWMIALDLAHDKLTIKSYMERLIIYGFFILKNGQYIFCGSQKSNLLSYVDTKKVINQTRVIYERKRKPRSW